MRHVLSALPCHAMPLFPAMRISAAPTFSLFLLPDTPLAYSGADRRLLAVSPRNHFSLSPLLLATRQGHVQDPSLAHAHNTTHLFLVIIIPITSVARSGAQHDPRPSEAASCACPFTYPADATAVHLTLPYLLVGN